ncbi:MAG: carboxymuconolactone decarboxylase family protein [Rhodocyclaceae bacterium]|jgi:AhpD family alkylhydroperoxidase|nr:carboxymuconolactone decarboxylase family protein [Zoogloeaceae bacterium]MBP9655322.1 carboxymuconolactone decarboxylase family protein [Rhodocyclaceae bacterium]MCQ3924026.1 carboxymuconolactone decarboxylase family protein [Rhodocyclaceae bacterium]
MQQRLDYKLASPEAFKAMLHTEQQIHRSGLEASLLELVKTRASQINGCAWCLDMHTKDARAQGETEQRLYLLTAWREAPCYSARERAALAWTEAVTRIAETHDVPDAAYEEARRHFDEKALVDLTLAIIAINGWNRLNVAFRTTVGDYVSPHGKAR